MASLGEEMPKEITRVRELQDQYKALRGLPNVIIEPQIMMMEASIQRGVNSLASGDVIEIMRAYQELKDWQE